MNDRGALTIPEFAEWVGIGRTMVFAEIKAGRLAVVKCRKRTLVRMADANVWLNNLPKAVKAA
jgi:hypothetical protein